jgi:hypothetical protein
MQYTHPCGEPTMRWFGSRRRRWRACARTGLSIKLRNPLPLWLLRKLVLEIHAQRTRFACLIRLRLDYSRSLSHENGKTRARICTQNMHKKRPLSALRGGASAFCAYVTLKSPRRKNELLLYFFVRNLSSLKTVAAMEREKKRART